MNRRVVLLLLSVASARLALGQAMTCDSGTSSARACDAFHYHVQLYRPDTRAFVEVTAVNRFASQSACDRARQARLQAAMAVADYMKGVKKEQKYEADRIGPCHCDQTTDRSSPNFVTDAQRLTQIRSMEEVRLRQREHLLDSDLKSDSELVRRTDLTTTTSTALIGSPRLSPLPALSNAAPITSAADLRLTETVQSTAASTSSFDLPLAPVGVAPAVAEPVSPTVPPLAAPPPAVASATEPPPDAPQPVAPQPPVPAEAQQPAAAEPMVTTTATPEIVVPFDPAPAESEAPTTEVEAPAVVDDAAEVFIAYETARIQSVLKASSAMIDDVTRSRVLEASMQRIQLLSNLRSLIEGSGTGSRLARAARSASDEEQRLALVAKLFGSQVASQWAPRNTNEVVVEVEGDVAADPERVLRDGTGKFTDAQRRQALYVLLGRGAATDEQQLWLTTVIDEFLQ